MAQFESPQVVFFYLLHRIALGGDQGNSQRDAHRQLYGIAVRYVGIACKSLEAPTQMRYRLKVRPGFRGALASFQPEVDSGFTLASLSKVVRYEFWLAVGPRRIHFHKDRG